MRGGINMSEQLLQQILEKLNNIESEQQAMKSDQQAMKSDIQFMRQDVNNVKINMATKEDVADIPAIRVAVLEAIDTVNRIENTQVQHERILDLLSRRSIEQEAELRRIK
jgi:hypothetical protein